MVYYTTKLNPKIKQMTLEDLLFGDDIDYLVPSTAYEYVTNTRTFELDHASKKMEKKVPLLYARLEEFNSGAASIASQDRHSLYREFYIPKKSGGLRKIDAPNDMLSGKLRELKSIFENDFGALYHTAAYAYVKHRSIVNCLEKHQRNESKWFAKFDFHNFFGSTTEEFILQQLRMIYPFAQVMQLPGGEEQMRKAIDLCMLDGGLPQGTPISPMLTNVIMIPIDFNINRNLTNEHNKYVYTRYADDIQISSKYAFDWKAIQGMVRGMVEEFNAPFSMNEDKTRYGSSAGRNWNLGLMLNGDNKITVGAENKRRLKAMLTSYTLDRKHGVRWGTSDVQVLLGKLNYCRMVEKETIDGIVAKLNNKFNSDIYREIKSDLKGEEL